ncbi:MAG: hypothetical protein HY270_11130 [Deltaproteobacteria bacterium]|nr:hypothetical protein [Deltaproteobacteria bacterium]
MKFDLLYELQAPKPHTDDAVHRCYNDGLTQIELADRERAAKEIKSTPYRDLIAKEYPIILKMMKNECT